MNIVNWLFRRNRVSCPRCLGKGHVDMEDIKRLKMEFFWGTGTCAYCNGSGKVSKEMTEKLSADLAYLTTDLPSIERHKLMNGNRDALNRAKEFNQLVNSLIEDIEHMYYIDNMEPDAIAEQIFYKQGRLEYSITEKNETVDYVEIVIKSKLKN